MSTEQVFANTIAQLQGMSLAELAAFKLEIGEKAFADRGDALDLDTPRDDVDTGETDFHDATTEAYLAVLDLIDQELERRRGRVIVTEIDG
jgi:hypothetical protein